MKSVLGFVEFQAAWWATALLARAGHGAWAAAAAALFVVAHLARARRRFASGALVVLAAVLGVIADGALRAAGVVSFPVDVDMAPSPPFMIALWAAFACTLETSLAGLATRPLVAAVVGGVGGALAYRGAQGLGVLALHDGVRALAAVGAVWLVATPALGLAATGLKDEAAARRARSIPLLVVAFLLLWGLAPLWLALGIVVDTARFLVARRPFMSLRVLAFGLVYATSEVAGVVALLVVKLRAKDAADLVARTYRVQAAWTWALFTSVSRIFELSFRVEGDSAGATGPVVVLVRHASIIDTLLPSVFFTRRHGLKLRFVLKKELLEDPCLDIAGNRLPNHFVSRRAEGTDADLAAVRALAAPMTSSEGALIYPEGTRFTSKKRARAVESLTAKDPALGARAAAMLHVMPPKPGGAFALLDGCPAADAVFVAHAGLEGFSQVKDIWSEALLGREVRVRAWRVARGDIPQERAARTAWLYDEWQKVDAFVGATAP
jgi:1-acyl-sn-glycerol-3-phosphate acyltransferase